MSKDKVRPFPYLEVPARGVGIVLLHISTHGPSGAFAVSKLQL